MSSTPYALGERTLVWVFDVRSRRVAADVAGRLTYSQRRRKKRHLIEAAPFGRLDQMLRTAVQSGVWRGFASGAKNG